MFQISFVKADGKKNPNHDAPKLINQDVIARYQQYFQSQNDLDLDNQSQKDSHHICETTLNQDIENNANPISTASKPQPTQFVDKDVTSQPYLKNKLVQLKTRKLSRWIVGKELYLTGQKVQKSNTSIGIKRQINFEVPEEDFQSAKKYIYQNYSKILEKYDENVFIGWLREQCNHIELKQSHYKGTEREYSLANLILELEYRFYIQYIIQQRTFVEKVLTNDIPPHYHVVLFIYKIQEYLDQQRCILILSDGWHTLPILLDIGARNKPSNDNFIYDLIKREKIFIGQKLHIMNMEPYPVKLGLKRYSLPKDNQIYRLKLNSLKRASLQTCLGIQNEIAFFRSFKSVKPFGGTVSNLILKIINRSQTHDITYNYQQNQNQDISQQKFCFILVCIDCLDLSLQQTNLAVTQQVYILVQNASEQFSENLMIGSIINVINSEIVQSIYFYKTVNQSIYGLLVNLSQKCRINFNEQKIHQNSDLNVQQQNQINFTREIYFEDLHQFQLIVREVQKDKVFGITEQQVEVVISNLQQIRIEELQKKLKTNNLQQLRFVNLQICSVEKGGGVKVFNCKWNIFTFIQ